VYPDTLFIGDKFRPFLCIPMKIGVKFEQCQNVLNHTTQNVHTSTFERVLMEVGTQ
jgi:hypothetical protein